MSAQTIIGIFDDEEALMKAMHQAKSKGVGIEEVYSPYPVFEAFEAIGRKSNFRTVAYFYGLFAAIGVLSFLYYTSVIDWPLVYGGKPFNSFPSFIVVTLVLTIFSVTVLSLLTFSVRAKLFPGKKAVIVDPRATDDKFVLVLQNKEGMESEISSLLREAGASEIKDN